MNIWIIYFYLFFNPCRIHDSGTDANASENRVISKEDTRTTYHLTQVTDPSLPYILYDTCRIALQDRNKLLSGSGGWRKGTSSTLGMVRLSKLHLDEVCDLDSIEVAGYAS